MTNRDNTARDLPRTVIATLALAVLAVAITWTTLERGPWYDEFYTQYVTRPGQGWLRQLTTSWLPDNHPPFFYMLMHATAWLGAIEAHRLVNLLIAALALAGGWITTRRNPQLRAIAAVLILALMASRWTIHTATELRSYFTSLCVGALLPLALSSIWTAPSQAGRGRHAVYALTVLVAFNTHITTTLFSGAFLVPFLATALIRRDRERLRALLPAPVAAGLVFLGVTAFQVSYWDGNTRNFWIPSGFDAAFHSVKYVVLRTLQANPVITLGAAAGGVLLCRDYLRTRKVPDMLAICLLGGIGITLAFALLTGVHMMRPSIIEKYLVPAVGVLAFLMAAACSRLLAALPRRIEALLLLVALAASGVALADNVRMVAARETWLGTGRLIARTVAACPSTTVHTDDFWNADVMAMSPTDNRHVAPWAYQRVAARLGFTIAPVSSRELSAKCPNLFWAEHTGTHRFNEANILEHVRQSGFAVDAITLYRVGNGWVASDRPLQSEKTR